MYHDSGSETRFSQPVKTKTTSWVSHHALRRGLVRGNARPVRGGETVIWRDCQDEVCHYYTHLLQGSVHPSMGGCMDPSMGAPLWIDPSW